MKGLPIDNLKLRASWGKLGNNAIGNYEWQAVFLFKGGIGTTAAAMVMIVVMLPGFLFGVYEKNGQPLEVVGRQIIESCFLRPKERPYQTVNAYDALVCQYQMEQEVKAIVEKSRQRGSKKHGGQAQAHPRRKKTD